MGTREWLTAHQVAVYAAAVAAAVATALTRPELAPAVESLIEPVLVVLLYATFLEVPFVRLREAVADRRFLGAALGLNFLVVPAVAWALTRPLSVAPVALVGVYLVLLTPCIDYVIAFTELAGGDSGQVTAITPALLAVQLLLLPAYLWLFMGREVATVVEAGPFVEAFLTFIAAPLALAWLTEAWAERSPRGQRVQSAAGWLPVPAMAATLAVVIASQLPRVRDSIDQIAAVVPVYVAFLVVMPLLARVVASRLKLDAGRGRALVFTSVTRNSLVVLPLALALPAGYELAPAVVVTQTLVELCGMVVLTRVVPAWLVADDPEPVAASAGSDDD